MKKLFILAAAALSLTACSNTEDMPVADNNTEKVAIEVKAGISTRVNGNKWEKGDQIGVSTTGTTATILNNVCFTSTATDQNSSVDFDSEAKPVFADDKEATFFAYYPYTPDGDEITANTEDQTNRKSFDFMFARGAKASKENTTVNFSGDAAFLHKMARLVFNFVSGDDVVLNRSTFEELTIENITWTGTFNKKTGEAKVDTKDTADNGASFEPVFESDAQDPTQSVNCGLDLIIFPQESTLTTPMKIILTAHNQTYQVTAPGVEYKSGNMYTYTVKVTSTEATLSATIADWNKEYQEVIQAK